MKRVCSSLAAASLVWLPWASAGERINQEGRILGSPPVVTDAVLFNTPAADAIVSAMQIFPVTNAWNEDISRRPLLANSDAMMAQIISDLGSSRRCLRGFFEMNFVLAPDSQPLAPIALVTYPEESDPGPYPIPSNMPIEGWPIASETIGLTLLQWQQNVNDSTSDRHAIIVQPGNGFAWETWQTVLTGGDWQAANGAKFDLKSNALRPAGWTSGDAAGLTMFPALVRYDECQRGMVEHACRLVVARSRQACIYPATHYASSDTSVNRPAMGQRLRLKSSFVIPAGWANEEKAVLLGLKKHGAMVADNGGFFSISITPDDRWAANAFDHLSSIGVTNFEVIQTTGPNEGPRSPGAPTASAGADRSVAPGTAATLQGFVTYTGNPPAVQWKLYSGPGTVTFGNPSQTNSTVSFSAPGAYTLMLSADDAVHAVAYDAVVLTVGQSITLALTQTGANLNLTWTGGAPPYVVERADSLSAGSWSPLATTNGQSVALSIAGRSGFLRVRGQ